MTAGPRKERVSDLIQAEVARLLQTSMHDVRLKFVTVTGVSMTSDLRHARIHVSTLAAILLHLRDPFLALHRVCRLTRETVIVVDQFRGLSGPYMEFLGSEKNLGCWWSLSPEIIVKFLKELGFEDTRTSFHSQKHMSGAKAQFFTIVGRRTRAMEAGLADAA